MVTPLTGGSTTLSVTGEGRERSVMAVSKALLSRKVDIQIYDAAYMFLFHSGTFPSQTLEAGDYRLIFLR